VACELNPLVSIIILSADFREKSKSKNIQKPRCTFSPCPLKSFVGIGAAEWLHLRRSSALLQYCMCSAWYLCHSKQEQLTKLKLIECLWFSLWKPSEDFSYLNLMEALWQRATPSLISLLYSGRASEELGLPPRTQMQRSCGLSG